MATKKQIEANRRNAAKSTGPRTEAGKARASGNATKHGLTSRRVVLSDEDDAVYQELRRNLHEEFAPESQMEVLIVNRIAAQQWRLARVPALEAELLERLRYDATGADEGLGHAWARDAGPYEGALAKLTRYEVALDRSVTRLLDQLRRLRTVRTAHTVRKEFERPAPARARAGSGTAAGTGAETGDGAHRHGPWWEEDVEAWPLGGLALRASASPTASLLVPPAKSSAKSSAASPPLPSSEPSSVPPSLPLRNEANGSAPS